MSCKIFVASILAIASAISFCTQAKAETTDVSFDGNIVPKCTFSNVIAGTLATGSSKSLIEGSKSYGTQGSVDLLCNTNATVTIGEPSNKGGTGPSTFTGAYYGSLITIGTNTAGSKQAVVKAWQGVTKSSLSISTSTLTNIKVSMVRDTGSAEVQAGTYSFTTTLTSTP
jgi:hypothetical protein